MNNDTLLISTFATAYTKEARKNQKIAKRKRPTCDSTAGTDPKKSHATARCPQNPQAEVSLDMEGSSAQRLASQLSSSPKNDLTAEWKKKAKTIGEWSNLEKLAYIGEKAN